MGDWNVCDCGALHFRSNGDICDSCGETYCGECMRGVFVCNYYEFVKAFGELSLDDEHKSFKICADCLLLHLVENGYADTRLFEVFEKLKGLMEERRRLMRDIENSYSLLHALLSRQMAEAPTR